ncbi:hypothetical protein BH10BAC5_BH10BAC5_27420 [soil metagenome]
MKKYFLYIALFFCVQNLLAQENTNEVPRDTNETETEEIIISTTRGSRTIDNVPTRVEAISGEELDEKANMKPGEIRMVLSESTGIQTQQTSATSYNSSIRIQGLDGKYTQIIRDGFPLYSEFSGGLGLLQIAPLDLQQVEVIKGSASTLYGGGAIAGLVNLVSKTPGYNRELKFLINGTSALGLDLNGFYSQRFGKYGITFFAAYDHGTAYDPAKIDLTAIPKFDRFILNPKLFLYFNKNTAMSIGVNATVEDRIGGDLHFIEGNSDSTHSYYEKNKTNRYSTQISLEHTLNEKAFFTLKNSVGYYDRSIELPGYKFSGVQISSYTEGVYVLNSKNSEWIGGLNFVSDKFTQDVHSSASVDYNYYTIGSFIQNTWGQSKKLTFETGLRGDYQNIFGLFVLPRLSALYKVNDKLTTRITGGLGYKTPTVFTEDAEKISFRNVLPINTDSTMAERSYGGNFDVNYVSAILNNKVSFSINQLFFYTRVNNPLLLAGIGNNYYQFQQPSGFIDTKGIETNIKLTYNNFKLFFGYTYTDVKQHYNVTEDYYLVSKHKVNNVLIYEVENNIKLGLEAYYFSPQKLNDGTNGNDYWLTGFMAEKIWESFSVFVNFENYMDVRQTKFGSIYSGSLTNPVFKDIYAPLDGFVINGGIKIRL